MALGTAATVFAETPANAASPASVARPADAASRAGLPISPRDAAVRQVVLGIVSFTHWPTPPARLRLCLIGKTAYAQGLLDAQQAGSTPLDVQHIAFDDPAIGTVCDIVYFGSLSDDEIQRVRAAVADHPVLTISEDNPSCTTGSMFCLNVDDNPITFDINLDAVARSGVRVHPNVLNLSRRPVAP